MSNSSDKEKVISGLTWKLAERMFSQGMTFVLSIILARLLMPSQYGIVAMINIFIVIANVFVTAGFSSSLIQKKDADDLVLDPLEIMIEIVEKVEKDPIGAKNIEELQDGIKAEIENINEENNNKKNNNNIVNNPNHILKRRSTISTFKPDHNNEDNYEVTVIKSAIIKISALLAIGFGDAGGEIIAKNLSNNHKSNHVVR